MVNLYSNIKMMHGPIHIRFRGLHICIFMFSVTDRDRQGQTGTDRDTKVFKPNVFGFIVLAILNKTTKT